MQKDSFSSTALPTHVIFCPFDGSHYHGPEVIAPGGFVLHFPADDWHRASFHVSVGHVEIFSGKMSPQLFALFWLVYLFSCY